MSKDGTWRSFPKGPKLLQYIGSAIFFAWIKNNGKLIRQSLKTMFGPTAKRRRVKFRKRRHEARASLATSVFTAADAACQGGLPSDPSNKPPKPITFGEVLAWQRRSGMPLCLWKPETT